MIYSFFLGKVDDGLLIATLELAKDGETILFDNKIKVRKVNAIDGNTIGIKKKDGKYLGTNGLISRYNENSVVILLKTTKDKKQYYYCFDRVNQTIDWVSSDRLITVIKSKQRTLANGKCLVSENGNSYVSAISGQYIEVIIKGDNDYENRKGIKETTDRAGVCGALQENGSGEGRKGPISEGVRGSNVGVYSEQQEDYSCRNRISRTLRGLNVELNEKATPSSILGITEKCKMNNPKGACVDVHELSYYKNCKSLITFGEDGCVAVQKDGDITNLVKDSNSQIKGFAKIGMTMAVANGGIKCDCFNVDGGLPSFYCKCGFIPVARVKFSRDCAPEDWDYNSLGEPDIIFMAYCGDNVDDMYENHSKGYKKFSEYDYSTIPLFEDDLNAGEEGSNGKWGYDKAWEYRDKLIANGELPNPHTNEFKPISKQNGQQEKIENDALANGLLQVGLFFKSIFSKTN